MSAISIFKIKDHPVKRILMSVFGVLVCGIAVGLFRCATFGVDPFQSFMSGLESLVPISFGTLYVIVNALLLIFSLVCDRHYIGIATFVNLFLLGYVVQLSYYVLQHAFPQPSLAVRIVFFIIGVAILCLASAFYITADLGVSTYDAIALIITQTWQKGQFRFVRIITDVICVASGVVLFLLSGDRLSGLYSIVGAGTIVLALFMGPLVDLFSRKIAKPFLFGVTADSRDL